MAADGNAHHSAPPLLKADLTTVAARVRANDTLTATAWALNALDTAGFSLTSFRGQNRGEFLLGLLAPSTSALTSVGPSAALLLGLLLLKQDEKRLLNLVSCEHQRVGSVTEQADVPVDHPAERGAEGDVGGDPRWEYDHALAEGPLRGPWQADMFDAKSFDHDVHPTEDSNDEDHCEHHRFHHRHLEFGRLGHQVHLHLADLFEANVVARATRLVHQLPELLVAVIQVGLLERIHEERAKHRVDDHDRGTDQQDRGHEILVMEGNRGLENTTCDGCHR